MIYRTNLRIEGAEQTVRKYAWGLMAVAITAGGLLMGAGADLREHSRLVEREAEVWRLQREGQCRDVVHYYTANDHDYTCPRADHVLHHEGAHVECRCK